MFEQYTIKVFVELMWQEYRPLILYFEFLPYMMKLFCFFMLSSAMKLNYINIMTVYEDDLDGVRQTYYHNLVGNEKRNKIIY